MKKKRTKYYIIWIEGFSYRRGEKILSLDDNDHDYTLKLTEAMRVRPEHLDIVEERLKAQGVSNWVFEQGNTFQPTYYAPKGTIFKP